MLESLSLSLSLYLSSVGEKNIDSTRENHRHRAPESVHHEWHHLSTPQRRQHQQNVYQKPVVLLNSGYQLLNDIINEQLKRIVEQTNVLEPGQGGCRQGRSVNIDMQKMHFVTHEAHRQGKRVF